jgi:chromate reductase
MRHALPRGRHHGDILMITLIGISGSLRRGSYNSAVLRAAAALMPVDSTLTVASIAGIPLYDGDVESAQGSPAPVAHLKDAIAEADGLVLVSPEYNNNIPGVAKNAIDWLSRPPADAARVFAGKPVAIAGASPGGFGTVLAQNAWLPVFRTLGAEVWPGGRLAVSRAGGVIDAEGNITDAATRENIARFITDFVAHVRRLKALHEAEPPS